MTSHFLEDKKHHKIDQVKRDFDFCLIFQSKSYNRGVNKLVQRNQHVEVSNGESIKD